MEDVEAEATPTHITVPIYVIQKASQVMFWLADIDLLNANVLEKKKDFLSKGGIPPAMKDDDGCQLYVQRGDEITMLKDDAKLTVDLAAMNTHLLLVDSFTNPKTHKVKLGALGLTGKGDII